MKLYIQNYITGHGGVISRLIDNSRMKNTHERPKGIYIYNLLISLKNNHLIFMNICG
jgi:hypothetical protein